MAQSLPVVRDLFIPGLLPQVAMIVAVAATLHWIVPTWQWANLILLAAGIYLVFCRTLRGLLTSHHSAAMKAYQSRDFERAVAHNLASYEFFTRHPVLDMNRHLLFGVASRNPYRTVALCNAGYSEAMRGNQQAAAQHFSRALELTPRCTNAEVGLAMVRGEALATQA